MTVLFPKRQCLLFGETDGVWTITTYLEKGPTEPGVDILPAKGYTGNSRGTFRLPERRIVAERNIGALAGGLRLE